MCKKLKEHAMKIINYEEKEMMPLTYEENNKFYEEQDACNICEGKFCMDEDDENYKNSKKVKDTAIIQGNLEKLLIAFGI